ncbi:unnamed protein product [Amoebophrya sp. A25]|nr:unnamed protein product [Amoebophrya sp. A25]|eukprot:GSA25T00013595001.1
MSGRKKGYSPTVTEVNSVARELEGLGLSDTSDEERMESSPIAADLNGGVSKRGVNADTEDTSLRKVPLPLQRGKFGRLVDELATGINPAVVLRMRCLVIGSAGAGKTSIIRRALGMKNHDGRTFGSIPKCEDRPKIKKRATLDKQSYLPTMGLRCSLDDDKNATGMKKNQQQSSDFYTQPGAVAVDPKTGMHVFSGPEATGPSCYTIPVLVEEANLLVELHCYDLGASSNSMAQFDHFFKAFSLTQCNAVICVCDLMQPKSFGVQKMLEKIRLPQLQLTPSGVILGNKLDQLYDPSAKKFTTETPPEVRQGAEAAGFGYFETSIFAEDDSLLRPFHYLAENYARRYRKREEALKNVR